MASQVDLPYTGALAHSTGPSSSPGPEVGGGDAAAELGEVLEEEAKGTLGNSCGRTRHEIQNDRYEWGTASPPQEPNPGHPKASGE